ncbi:MAG TPA: hypothetical protein VK549_09275, partial [Acidimicrobiia bacterium]|nr:hypothetical protein [Acidimicrobiia bacterium]
SDDASPSITDEQDRARLEAEPRPASTFTLEPPELARRPPRERGPRRGWHVLKVAVACVLGLVVAAGAVVLFSAWLSNRSDKSVVESTTTTVAPSTTSAKPTDSTTATTVADAPQAHFIATCPEAGQGWAMVPVWPGTFEGLAYYEYSVQSIPDGSWIRLGALQSPDAGTLNVPAIAPGDKRIVRITPALRDGTAGEPMFAVVTAPTGAC